MPPEDDDPVIASYNVYISPHPHSHPQPQPQPPSEQNQSTTNPTPTPSQSLYILQYPSHRPHSKPYTTSRSQKPTSLRLKPTTGVFEIDVPILTSDNYNAPLGTEFGRAINESARAHPTTGSSYGLAGGFTQGHSGNQAEIPGHAGGTEDESLRTQTLGGKLDGQRSDRDPVYMLATLNQASKSISLRHLDGVVQMRPQLHHIDAQEEGKRKVESANRKEAKKEEGGAGAGVNGAPVKLETKAIEMKLKDSTREDPKDRNLNLNARLLRDIQNDPWRRFEWVERGDEAFSAVGDVGGSGGERVRLKSALDNEEWLNRMSSPGIELRTRLKGRDRERARRKRQERQRNARAAEANSAAGGLPASAEVELGSETSSSDEEEHEGAADIGPAPVSVTVDANVESEATRAKSPEPQIKQEGGGGGTSVNVTAAPAPKRRGRPPKNAGP